MHCTGTCNELLQLGSSRLLWRPLVTHKNKQQRTLYSEFSHDWKRTYVAMQRLDTDPKYFDHLWNVVVIGDRRVGKSRLVSSLAHSANLAVSVARPPPVGVGVPVGGMGSPSTAARAPGMCITVTHTFTYAPPSSINCVIVVFHS